MTENEDYAQQDLPVSNETESAQPDDETSTDITAPIEPEIQPAKKKPGRKRFDTVNGEKKSEKLMLYLTPELIAKIRVWCDMKGVSNVGYITALIEADLDSKKDKINTFLELRKGLQLVLIRATAKRFSLTGYQLEFQLVTSFLTFQTQ